MMWKAFEEESTDIEADMQKLCPMNVRSDLRKGNIIEEKNEICYRYMLCTEVFDVK